MENIKPSDRPRRKPPIVWLVALALTLGIVGGPLAARPGVVRAEAAPPPAETADGITWQDLFQFEGGPRNQVKLRNQTDGRLRIRGNVQLNRITGPEVKPVNVAYAYGSCTDCQTIAVALQLNLYSRGAPVVTPQNGSLALNYQCTRCVTVALAYQYVYPVDDPKQVPPEVSDLIRSMDRELQALHSDKSVTLSEAADRIDSVVNRFIQFAESLNAQRAETTDVTSPDATAN